MERRSFLSALFAPLIARFLPAKPVADLPVASIPLMGSGALRIPGTVPVLEFTGWMSTYPSVNRFSIKPGDNVFAGTKMVVDANNVLVVATDPSQPAFGWALEPPDDKGIASVIMTWGA